ncbi:hypothetical protein [Naasia sp. SYSU D00948]|uniref:hypothetical protein n=1 Tax=Naasia sp. SYSU D00948 TaxID=2817379 RepID=UPI001B30C64D|nr:hypothetical protein [Naasia sp. SYSU D00948]
MTGRESTLQSLDPLGALAGRPLTVLAGAAASVLAIVLTLSHGEQVGSLPVALAAVAVAVLASAALVVVTAPVRAPVTRRAAVLVVVLGFAAHVLFAVATWGQNTLVRDDWGPFVLGLLLLALCPYRPPREVVILAIAVAVPVAVVTVVETRFFVTGAPTSIYVIVAIVPVLALAFAGAAFARAVVLRIERWREHAEKASLEHAGMQEEGIVRSVQQSRVSILNRDVVPLFTELLDTGRVTGSSAARAAEVSRAIRGVMVAETERSWLDDVVVPFHAGASVEAHPVRDPDRLAERMDFDQRAAVRALASGLHDRLAARDIRIALERTGDASRVLLTCSTDLDEAAVPASLAPYLAVLRVVFEDVALDTSRPDLTLRFSYVSK